MDFRYENKNLGETFPQENGNFQTAVKIVRQVVLTQNFAFTRKFRCRI